MYMRLRKITVLSVLSILLILIVLQPSLCSNVGASNNVWTQMAPMQQARAGLGVVSVNDKIYAIGGDDGEALSTNEVYDPATNSWEYKAPMPTARYNFAIAVVQNKIYCIGGITGYHQEPEDHAPIYAAVNEVYDTTTDTWETKAAMPTARVYLQANTVNGKIYLIGGQTPGTYDTYTDASLSVNEEYDPTTDTWTTKASIPVGTRWYASTTFANKVYVFGGLQLKNIVVQNSTQIYDPKTDQWSSGAHSPLYAAYSVAAITNGKNASLRIYLFDAALLHYQSAQVYNPFDNSWSVDIAKPTDRSGFGVATANDLIYAIGGIHTTYHYPDYFDSLPDSYTVEHFALNERYSPLGYGTGPDPLLAQTPTPTQEPNPRVPIANETQNAIIASTAVIVIAAISVAVGVIYRRKK